ncbi:hypothetical protein TRAPUB_14354, partial [Trametes pubescens]
MGETVVVDGTSRYFKSLLNTAVIRYKFALAGAGMVDGPASGVPVKDRLLALERYSQSWKTAELTQDPEFPIDRNEHWRCLTFTGGALPIIQGSELRLVVPASPARGIRSQVWSMDLGDVSSQPLRCTTDLSQSLFVMCCLKPHPTRALECQIYSLSDTTVSLHPEAAVPAISADAGSAHEPFVVQMDICHDLLIWSWYADSEVRTRVYNWKSGIVVWESADSNGTPAHFAFLDQHHLVVASNNGSQLYVYTVDPNKPASTVQAPVTASLDHTAMCILSLPPTKEGSSVQIKQLSSQQTSSGRPGYASAFEHDAQLTILAISLRTVSEPSGDSQAHTLVVPTSALLGHASNAGDDRGQPSHADGIRGDVPWEAWGAPCSRLFPLANGTQWWDVRAVGSRCLFFYFRTGRPIALDILVAHFSPWARYGTADGGVDPLAEYADTSDVITVHENLVGPIHNGLPFHAVRMTVTYGEAVDFNWFNSFVALLPDGVAVT